MDSKHKHLRILGIAVHTIDHFAEIPVWEYSMAFVYLKAYLQRFEEYEQVSFEIKNYHQNEDLSKSLQEIETTKPDIVLFSAYVWNFDIYQRLAVCIKETCASTLIVLGGPEVSSEMEAILAENPAFDIIVNGEGEVVFHELVKYFLGRQDIATIGNITYRNAKGRIVHQPRGTLPDINEVPSVFSESVYDWHTLNGSYLALETQRGCNFSCGFCRYRRIDGSGARFFSLSRIDQELNFIKTIGPRFLYLMDPTFNNNLKRAKHILRRIIDLELDVEINAEMVPEFMDEELLELAIQAGVRNLEIGIQSIHKPVLNIMQRPRRHKRLVDTLNLAADIEVNGKKLNVIPQIIYGLPGDNLTGYCESFDFVYNLKFDEIATYHLLVLRDTQFFNDRHRHGLIYEKDPPHRLLASDSFPESEVVEAGKMSCVAMNTQYFLRDIIKQYCADHKLKPSEFFLNRLGLKNFDCELGFSFPIYTQAHLDSQLACLKKIEHTLRDHKDPSKAKQAVYKTKMMSITRFNKVNCDNQ